MSRQTIIYIEDIIGSLYPDDNIYPSDDLYPNRGTLIIGEGFGNNNIGITSGSLKLSQILVDSSIVFGQCYANKFEVQLFNCNYDIANKRIRVEQRIDDIQIPLFVGYIDSSTKDNSNIYRDIVAYDSYYFNREKDVARYWNNLFPIEESKLTVKQLRNSLLDFVGIPYIENPNLPNDDFDIYGYDIKFDSITFDTVFRMLCEFSCCLPNINPQGKMDYVRLKTDIQDISKNFENNSNSTFEDYITDKLTGIQLYDSSDSVAQYYGTQENTYNISGNILMLNLSAQELDTVLANIYNELKDIQYTPGTVKLILSDFDLSLGDCITTGNGVQYILANEFEGSQLIEQTINSPAKGKIMNNTPSTNNDYLVMSGKVASIKHDIDSFKVEYGNYKTEVNTRFEQTDNSITAQVSAGIQSSNNYTDGKLALYVQKTDKGQVVSMLTGYADEIEFRAGNTIKFSGATVDISGNHFKLTSDKFKVDTDGKVECSDITVKGGSLNINNAFTVSTSGAVNCSNITVTGGTLNINDTFTVDTNGNCTANSFTSNSATITGGTFKVSSESASESMIEIHNNIASDNWHTMNLSAGGLDLEYQAPASVGGESGKVSISPGRIQVKDGISSYTSSVTISAYSGSFPFTVSQQSSLYGNVNTMIGADYGLLTNGTVKCAALNCESGGGLFKNLGVNDVFTCYAPVSKINASPILGYAQDTGDYHEIWISWTGEEFVFFVDKTEVRRW